MEQQKWAGEHKREVQQAEIDGLKDANDKEEREAARAQEDLMKHHDNMKENLKLDHEREMEKEKLKHQGDVDKIEGKVLTPESHLDVLFFLCRKHQGDGCGN